MLTVFSFLFLFLVITLAHEFGHLVMAKRAGIRVYEFSIGFGPKIFSATKSKTEYCLRAIPVGGFVRIAGMGTDKEDSSCPTSEQYQYKGPWQKFYSIAAGPIMNLLLAVLIFSFVFMLHGAPIGLSNEVASVVPGSEAEKIGLQVGDRVIAINGQKIKKMEEAISLIHKSSDKKLRLALERKNKTLSVLAVPQYNEKLKVGLIGFSPKVLYRRYGPLRALWAGFLQTLAMAGLIVYFLGQLITGRLALSGIAGPVGIAQVSGQYASRGFLVFIQFLAFFNINVAVLNLLPVPALDGGRLIFVILEAIRRKSIKIEIENRLHYAGIFVLLSLVAVVTVNDVIRLFFIGP